MEARNEFEKFGSGTFGVSQTFGLLCCCRRCAMTHAPAERRATRTSVPTATTIIGHGSGDESDAALLSTIVGSDSTTIPSAAEAASATPRVEESEVSTTAAVVEVGTAMVAVMRTLAAATRIVTSDESTPAAAATFCCKLDLSLSE